MNVIVALVKESNIIFVKYMKGEGADELGYDDLLATLEIEEDIV